MANALFTIGYPSTSADTNASLEVYKDIDTVAIENKNYTSYEHVYLSDYVKWLDANDGVHKYSESAHLLSNIILENQTIDKTNEEQVLSSIALIVKEGYDDQKNLYDKYTEPYRWRIAKLVNVKAVENSIYNIFTWQPGERIINPEFGSHLREYLYEGITTANTEKIMAEIRNCMSKWEPRANILRVADATTIDEKEDNTVHLVITYTIPSLGDEEYDYSYYYNHEQ